MLQQFPESKYPVIRYFLGDIRDKQRLKMAFEDVDGFEYNSGLVDDSVVDVFFEKEGKGFRCRFADTFLNGDVVGTETM